MFGEKRHRKTSIIYSKKIEKPKKSRLFGHKDRTDRTYVTFRPLSKVICVLHNYTIHLFIISYALAQSFHLYTTNTAYIPVTMSPYHVQNVLKMHQSSVITSNRYAFTSGNIDIKLIYNKVLPNHRNDKGGSRT